MVTVALPILNSGLMTPSSEIYSVNCRELEKDQAADWKPVLGICYSDTVICHAGLLHILT